MKTKILYVDDEFLNLEVFKANFGDRYIVVTCNSGPEGLKILNEQDDIKLVISDMKMPEMNGLEFISKAKEKYTDIAYFILTGFDITEEIKAALENNLIYKYFRKPINVDLIEGSIKQILKC